MKRIVFVTGDKGGVGKSFLSRLLLDWYAGNQSEVKAIDTDKTNSTLFRFFYNQPMGNIRLSQLDTDSAHELDELLNEIAESESNETVMLDCAARTLERLHAWMREVDFFSLSQSLGVKITLAFVLGPEKDCVAILKDSYADFGDQVEYVIVKNKAKGDQFSVYDDSNIRNEILLTGAIEIEIPTLIQKTSMEIDRRNLPFSVAESHPEIKIADRQRIIGFRRNAFLELEKAKHLWI